MGLPADVVASLSQEPEGFGIWPENMPIADAWLVVCGQWNTVSLADGRVLWHGLRYGDVGEGLHRAEIVLSPAQWAGLRLMERAAAKVLNGNRG